jgi:hypothetical protein
MFQIRRATFLSSLLGTGFRAGFGSFQSPSSAGYTTTTGWQVPLDRAKPSEQKTQLPFS